MCHGKEILSLDFLAHFLKPISKASSVFLHKLTSFGTDSILGWLGNVGQEENHAMKATQRMTMLKR